MQLKNIVAFALILAFICLYYGSIAGISTLAISGIVITIICALTTLFEKK